MSEKNYSQTAKEQIETIRALADENPREVIELITRILPQAEEVHDDPLLAELYYLMGSAYFDLQNCHSSAVYLGHAIGYYRSLKNWEQLAQCYNVLGITRLYHGDNAGSIDAFNNELDLAEEHRLLLPQMKAYINLASNCYEIQRFEEAMSFSRQAVEIFKDNEEQEQAVNYWIVHLSIYSKALARLGRVEEAERALAELDKLLAMKPQFAGTPFDQLPRLLLLLQGESPRIPEELLDAHMKLFLDPETAGSFIYETIEFMGQLLRLGEYERLRELIPVIDRILEPTDYYSYKLALSRHKIDYCLHTGNQKRLQDEVSIYCDFVDRQRISASDAVVSYLHVRSSLKKSDDYNRKLRRANRALQEQVNTDELTELMNRRGLNEMADQFFEHAKQHGECFGFEMLDIDHFKQINDTHGHAVGDQCLILLANLMRQICHQYDDVVCARYGGDEFVILYRGMTDEQVHQIASHLQEAVNTRSGSYDIPPMTISQGICNRIPSGKDDRLWDFSAMADRALYQVKENGRNSIGFSHEITE